MYQLKTLIGTLMIPLETDITITSSHHHGVGLGTIEGLSSTRGLLHLFPRWLSLEPTVVSLPWDGDLNIAKQLLKTHFGEIPCPLWPDMDCIFPLWWKKQGVCSSVCDDEV